MAPFLDLLVRNVRIVTCADAACAVSPLAYLGVSLGRIVGFGPMDELDPKVESRQEIDGEGALLTPGLIDCHTHLVHAGHRAQEFEWRLQGRSYEEIARGGGGIASTVAHTRSASVAELLTASAQRLQSLMRHGVTTVEIKSGYGLSLKGRTQVLAGGA